MPDSRLILHASPLLFVVFEPFLDPVFSGLCDSPSSGLMNHLERVEEGEDVNDNKVLEDLSASYTQR